MYIKAFGAKDKERWFKDYKYGYIYLIYPKLAFYSRSPDKNRLLSSWTAQEISFDSCWWPKNLCAGHSARIDFEHCLIKMRPGKKEYLPVFIIQRGFIPSECLTGTREPGYDYFKKFTLTG